MRKNALTITLGMLVLGIFGAFLRWLQTRNIFDAETGLAVRGAPISAIYIIYSVLVLAAIAALTLLWLRGMHASAEPSEALRSETAVPMVLTVILGAVFVCAALVALFTAELSRFPMLQRVFGAFAIFGGVCMPFLLPKRDGTLRSGSGAATVILTLFFCFWLIFAYKLNAEDPVVWAYAPEMLALAAATVGVYEAAAYFHGRAKPVRAVIALHAAAYLSVSVIFVVRATAMTALLGVCAALALLLSYLLIANMKENGD